MATQRTVSDALADLIRSARRERHLTAAQLAMLCRDTGSSVISPDVMRNIEAGRRTVDGARRRMITVDELVVIAEALDVPPDFLLRVATGRHAPVLQDEEAEALNSAVQILRRLITMHRPAGE